MSFAAVCYDPGRVLDAVRIAAEMRRAGEITELPLSGKREKQFARAKKDGAWSIVILRKEGTVLWRRLTPTIEATVDEVIHYYRWINDDSDALDDPPSRFFPEIVMGGNGAETTTGLPGVGGSCL